MKEYTLDDFDENFDEIMGLETSPDGEKDMLLTYDDDDNVIEGISFADEKILIKSYILSQLTIQEQRHKEEMEEVLEEIKKLQILELCEDKDTDLYEREVGFNRALELSVDIINKRINNYGKK